VSALSAEAVTAGYGGDPIVRGMSLTVGATEIVGIVGANGAGKSTFLKALAGHVPQSTGTIFVGEHEVTHLRPHDRVRCGLAYVPQQPENVFPSMTVMENLEVGSYTRKRGERGQVEGIFELFSDLRVASRKKAGALSGGQRQLLAFARGMMSDPSVVLLDEPTAGLSPIAAQRVWDHIGMIASRGPAVIVVEQNVKYALLHTQYVHVMVNGEPALQGTATEVAEHDLGAIFLGQREKALGGR
jgi:branched-chain amino acid transport system ATP-binding protein